MMYSFDSLFRWSIGGIVGSLAAWYLYTGRVDVIPVIIALAGWRIGSLLYSNVLLMSLHPPKTQ